MRILFQLPYPGYLRMYGSTVTLLAERGHRVLLAYDMPDKRRDAPAAEVEAHENVELVPSLPWPQRRLGDAVTGLRILTDFSRYLDPRFAEAPYLRERLERDLPERLAVVKRVPTGAPGARLATRLLLGLERLVPSDGGIERAICAQEPDVVLVTPLIARQATGVRQTDTVKAARRVGLPVGLAVASWDHLTTKGLIKAVPDRVFVWNEGQKREAVELHRVPAERVVVTGGQLFDGWFARGPSVGRDEFVGRLGLDSGRPYALFVGSSPAIAPAEKEIRFVRRWLAALRESGEPSLAGLGVLVRPHPGNMHEWARVELGDPHAAIAPTIRPNIPMSEEDEALYYDSIHFAAAVVGINTSAMVESFVQRRAVLALHAPEFRGTQEGTLHFRHLDAVQRAASFEEHFAQLRRAVEDPGSHVEAIETFLRAFVRPHGLEAPATPVLADAIEELSTLGVRGRATRRAARRPAVRTGAS